MYDSFVDNLKKKEIIAQDDKVLACVSGGVDSISMLNLLLRYFSDDLSKLEVAHFNHKLRGKDSDRDEDFVRDICKKNGIEYHLKCQDINKLAKDLSLSIEEAARKARHEFFYEIAGSEFKIALAHNQDDQAETVLMRIIRGTGPDGLIAMREKEGNIIRPLLTFSRVEIENYLKKNNLSYVQDETNFENKFSRNKLRNIVIPFIEEEFNPAFKKALVKLSEIASQDYEIKDMYLEGIMDAVINERNNHKVEFAIKKFSELDMPRQISLIRKAIFEIKDSLHGFENSHFLEFLKLLEASSGKYVEITGVRATRKLDSLVFTPITENDLDSAISFTGENDIVLNGYRIKFDTGKENMITIRKRVDGDRINYRGKEKKLKDFLIDLKIESIERDYLPIVEYDGKIIAIADLYINRELMGDMLIEITKIGEKL